MRNIIKGISAVNPVDVEKDYLLFTVDYCISHGFDHYQLIGPIHDGVKGNIDGMTFSKKYSRFNGEKNADYVNYCMDCVNEALEKLSSAGVKTYMWHHELELPYGFNEAFPEALNSYGDIEVTHPVVKDYLENKIKDFFDAYPKMDGIILTLHETKVPLLKLKNQKLEPVARVKYVTEILYNTCRELGKELIVRPFASIEEDYEMMTKAYEEISRDLVIMDKWTQFDWSLCLPSNRFYAKIKKGGVYMSLTPKMEKFCEYIVSGMSGKDAYITAYQNKSNDNTAYKESMKLLQRDDIADRIKEMRKPLELHAQTVSITERQKHIDFIKERIELCKQKEDENSIIRYMEQLAKIGGYYKEDVKEDKTENVISKMDTTTLLRLVE